MIRQTGKPRGTDVPVAYWGEASRTIFTQMGKGKQEAVPQGWRVGEASAEGIPFYQSAIQPRNTGGNAPGLPETLPALQANLHACLNLYRVPIPENPYVTPPAPHLAPEGGASKECGFEKFSEEFYGRSAWVRPDRQMLEQLKIQETTAEGKGAAAERAEQAPMELCLCGEPVPERGRCQECGAGVSGDGNGGEEDDDDMGDEGLWEEIHAAPTV
jgi:hypothetical protein